jgi:hypothetical protein
MRRMLVLYRYMDDGLPIFWRYSDIFRRISVFFVWAVGAYSKRFM